MSEPFLSEIRLMSFNFAPKGWAHCNGQLLPINQNQALFALIGTTYGGDGQTDFALPDLRGRTPLHAGAGHTLGESGGEQSHTLTTSELPAHDHGMRASTNRANIDSPGSDEVPGAGVAIYGEPQRLTAMESSAIGSCGGGQPHDNMQPYLTVSFCIALQGVFPSHD